MRNLFRAGILASTAISLGGIIYTLYRPSYLVLFEWYEQLGILDNILSLRELVADEPKWPDLVIYCLPNALWAFALTLLMSTIWVRSGSLKQGMLYIMLAPSFGVVTEFLQGLELMGGTFDWFDVSAYLLGSLVGWFGNKILSYE